MVNRKRPCVVSTRTTPAERKWIEALAAEEGVSTAEVVHRLLISGVRARIAEAVREERVGQVSCAA